MPINPFSGAMPPPDPSIASLRDSITGMTGKSGQVIREMQLYTVLPVPALSLRYLFQVNGLPLGRFVQVTGKEKSFKSTFMGEIARWVRASGGFSTILEAEAKFNETMIKAVTRHDSDTYEVKPTDSMEGWMQAANLAFRDYNKVCPESHYPFMVGVDSLMGMLPESVKKSLDRDGYASKHFADAAGLLNDFGKFFPQKISSYPALFIGINHTKFKQTADGRGTVRHIPGGRHLKYQESMELELRPTGNYDYSMRGEDITHDKLGIGLHPLKEFWLTMETFENSCGPARKYIRVPLYVWHTIGEKRVLLDEEQEAKVSGAVKNAVFDWWGATIYMFAGAGRGLKGQLEDVDLGFKVMKTKSSQMLYYCKEWGVPKSDAMTAHLLGRYIEGQPDLVNEIETKLGIGMKPMFRYGTPYKKQVEAGRYAAEADIRTKTRLAIEEQLARESGAQMATLFGAPVTKGGIQLPTGLTAAKTSVDFDAPDEKDDQPEDKDAAFKSDVPDFDDE